MKSVINFKHRSYTEPSSILITGASGAIGGALAKLYAKPGVTLHLQGRKIEALEQVGKECQQLGGTVKLHCLDLLDTMKVEQWLDAVDEELPLDLFIANAGVNINIGLDSSGEQLDEMANLLDLNIKATLLMSGQLAKKMRNREKGQVVLISSLAGFYGIPIMPSYCASKAALKAYGESLRGWLAGSGVGVSVVMPGNTKSAMCDNMPAPKPFVMSADHAALKIKRGVAKNKARISFPFPLNLGTWFLAVLPASVSEKILHRLHFTTPANYS